MTFHISNETVITKQDNDPILHLGSNWKESKWTDIINSPPDRANIHPVIRG